MTAAGGTMSGTVGDTVPAAVRAGRATLAGRAPGLLWRPAAARAERAGASTLLVLVRRGVVHPEEALPANGQQA